MPNIHPTALVDKKAQIAEDVTIGPFSIVEPDVVIGNGSSIASHVLLANGARIGANCNIHKGTVVATFPQDLKFKGEESLLIIDEGTTVREFCTLNRGTRESGLSRVGKDCLLMAYAHVAHDCVVGDHVILANGVQLGGHVHIGDWAIIGGFTPIHQFCKVGCHAMVGGGFRVVQDVPPYITVAGEPLQFAGLNSIGLRRRGFAPSTISLLKKAYKLIYRSHLNTTKALQRIRDEIELVAEIQEVIDFIESSERGIIKESGSR
jgi:UDP-N-acetylglucosamine acyltransferase